MGIFDHFMKRNASEDEAYTPIIPAEPQQNRNTVSLIRDDTIKPEEIYRPDMAYPRPAKVPHISLTYEEAAARGWHIKRKSGKRIRITRYKGTEQHVIIPSEIDGYIVNELGWRAFLNSTIESVMIPATLRKIGEQCFKACIKLKNVIFEDGITSVSKCMFESCVAMENVRLPEKLKYIGTAAFNNCRSLLYISIPNDTRKDGIYIGDGAFSNWSLEGYAIRPSKCMRINGTVFRITSMLLHHKLILSPEISAENEYKVLLFNEDAAVKFPKGSVVSLAEASVSKGCRLDMSECSKITVNDYSINWRRYPNGNVYFPNLRDEELNSILIILPQGYRGLWFPEQINVEYPDGTKYNGYMTAEKCGADSAVLTLYSERLRGYSLRCSERNVTLRMTQKRTQFNRNAVDSKEIEHLILEKCPDRCEEMFSPACSHLHCVEWDGKTVYIPDAELVGERVHRILLKAFHGRDLFDRSIIVNAFKETQRGIRLSQKQKILLSADILRSTESLYPDRKLYIHYLQTHRRYALLIYEKIPKEYSDFLREFYEAKL